MMKKTVIVYASKHHGNTFKLVKAICDKEVFFLYTCAMDRNGFTDSIKEIALEKDATILGEYGCKGYNTYGPWKLIGGMNKNHPTENEIQECINFYEKL